MKKIAILGSTGSIGRQALQVIDELPGEFKVVGLAAGANIQLLVEQIRKYKPNYVALGSSEKAAQLKNVLPTNVPLFTGKKGLSKLVEAADLDFLLVAVSGIHGLLPTLTALEKKITVGLANKETIVTAGALVMETAKKYGALLIPVDSEHSAIWQCTEKENQQAIEKIILTASGGPFLNFSTTQLKTVTPQMALRHPNWEMGAKITIDSATLINKGLEVIEAHWLFNLPYEKIDVIIHPESLIHSLVQYHDGSVLAQLGCPDMRVPIQYALTYPFRQANSFPRINLAELGTISFQKPDFTRFPGLLLALEAGKMGGTMPIVFNAANEIAVKLFLQNSIKFTEIPQIIEGVMAKHAVVSEFQIEDILAWDKWARSLTVKIAKGVI